jgi:trans-2,3-dihydro-3-hydroxyanthranilate isomerase
MPELSHPYEILDVFTDAPLTGNPLAVFTEGESVPSRLMLAAARELNLSETVFLLPGDGDIDAFVRIFTPAMELPFAGHPVLGAAFVVGERDDIATVKLQTEAGLVPVRLRREHGEIVFGEMDQPIPTHELYDEFEVLLDALGVEETVLPVEIYVNGPQHVVVTLPGPDAVATLSPDFSALLELGPLGINCCALNGDRIKTRNFCPGLGVAEDPATGSAAGPVAAHLARHGLIEFGHTVGIDQGAEIGRPSRLTARIEGGPGAITKVCVGGSAVKVAQGHFRLQ